MTAFGPRIVVIGNAGGGKSTLSRLLARRRALPLHELDRVAWDPGWIPVPPSRFAERHRAILSGAAWIMEGLGQRATLAERIGRATGIVLVDLPLWTHYALAADRQTAWADGTLADPPGGQHRMPPTMALFKWIWEVDRAWMPEIRALCAAAEGAGVALLRLGSIHELSRCAAALAAPVAGPDGSA